jgi:ribonuclease P protein component
LKRIENKFKIPAMPNFCKEERLSNQRHISVLQKEGIVFFNFPFKVKWIEISDNYKSAVKILPAVSKRNFKNAVDRNRIKRIIRESYRNKKEIILQAAKQKNKSIVIMILYTGKNIITYEQTETKIELILQDISNNV